MVNDALRFATLDDADAISAVHRAARRTAMPWLPDVHTPEEDLAFFRGVLARDEAQVACVDGRVVAFAVVAGEELAHLYVEPEAQGRGLGSALLEWAKEQRQEGLALWVFQRNEWARRFYERRGFRVVELTDGGGNEECEPDARYRWP